jgi:hypothetical protein
VSAQRREPRRDLPMIAVIIPPTTKPVVAGHCLAAVKRAVVQAEAAGLEVEVLVVLIAASTPARASPVSMGAYPGVGGRQRRHRPAPGRGVDDRARRPVAGLHRCRQPCARALAGVAAAMACGCGVRHGAHRAGSPGRMPRCASCTSAVIRPGMGTGISMAPTWGMHQGLRTRRRLPALAGP